ncbi:hypothetical protein [Streptomyces sp. H34-S4]|uniref:hypothetical protein n=1 Tax=Streptomyces sp. H34-S4 TaxID=2996463 RepID=UPI002270290A|nr:hypothetical protein [Streptomyces sp. H34-S4]MCY0933604.1 hypothetical protein [Streptomyces sp. H34-S4]
MNETTNTPKKPTRKPDPMAQIINELRTEIKKLDEMSTLEYPTTRVRAYDERASAWGRQYGKEGTTDGLILSLSFEALACYPHERRYSLVSLAAAALIAAERISEGQ